MLEFSLIASYINLLRAASAEGLINIYIYIYIYMYEDH